MSIVNRSQVVVHEMRNRDRINVDFEEWAKGHPIELLSAKSGISKNNLRWRVVATDYQGKTLIAEVWNPKDEKILSWDDVHKGMRIRFSLNVDIRALFSVWPSPSVSLATLGYSLVGWKPEPVDHDEAIIETLSQEAGLPSHLQLYEADWEMVNAGGKNVVLEIVGNTQQHSDTTIHIKATKDIEWRGRTVPAGITGILIDNKDEFAEPEVVVQVEFDYDYGDGGVYRHEIEITD